MKTTLTLILLCFALLGFTQEKFQETTFKIYFEGCVHLVQLDDFDNHGFYCDQIVKIKTNNYEEPFHIIVATDSTRGNLILTYSERTVILANWENKDLVLGDW